MHRYKVKTRTEASHFNVTIEDRPMRVYFMIWRSIVKDRALLVGSSGTEAHAQRECLACVERKGIMRLILQDMLCNIDLLMRSNDAHVNALKLAIRTSTNTRVNVDVDALYIGMAKWMACSRQAEVEEEVFEHFSVAPGTGGTALACLSDALRMPQTLAGRSDPPHRPSASPTAAQLAPNSLILHPFTLLPPLYCNTINNNSIHQLDDRCDVQHASRLLLLLGSHHL